MKSAGALLGVVGCATLWAAGGPAVRSVGFSGDGKSLIAGYEDGRVLVWTVDQARLAARWDGHAESVYAVAVIPGGKLVATGAGDGSIGLWSWPEGHVTPGRRRRSPARRPFARRRARCPASALGSGRSRL